MCGAFGMLVDDASRDVVHATMMQRLSICAGFASRFNHEILPNPVSLKGVGDVLCALLVPRPDRVEMRA
ncbi:hypothetical protein D3C83_226150 [compost metagenome]